MRPEPAGVHAQNRPFRGRHDIQAAQSRRQKLWASKCASVTSFSDVKGGRSQLAWTPGMALSGSATTCSLQGAGIKYESLCRFTLLICAAKDEVASQVHSMACRITEFHMCHLVLL